MCEQYGLWVIDETLAVTLCLKSFQDVWKMPQAELQDDIGRIMGDSK